MKSLEEIKAKVLELGGKFWEKNEMSRVYISCEILNKLRDEKELSEVNYSEKSNKIFLDCKTGNVMRSYKGKKPSLELELN